MQVLTVPYLIDNPEVGYVQARWTFANPDESYLTKVRDAVQCKAAAACLLIWGTPCKSHCMAVLHVAVHHVRPPASIVLCSPAA